MKYKIASQGHLVGTQRDAQRYFPRDWDQVDVPVSKVYHIEVLNENKVGATKTEQQQPVVVAPDPEQIDPESYGWVSWAYETLKRGDKHEAIKMLERGLSKQREIQNETN